MSRMKGSVELLSTAMRTIDFEAIFVNDVQFWINFHIFQLTACLHEGGGPQIGEVPRLGACKGGLFFYPNLITPPSWRTMSQDYWMAKNVNKKKAGKLRFLVINAILHSLAALAATFSAVALYCYL